MKKILVVSVVLLVIIWAVMFFGYKAGDASFIFLVPAGIIILFMYAMRRIIT